MITIEDFFKNSSDEQIQEFIKSVDMERFASLLDEYPPFVKQRVVDNVTDRVVVWIEKKIEECKNNPMEASLKEEFIKDIEEVIQCL